MTIAALESIVPEILPFRVPRALTKLLSRALGIEAIGRLYESLLSVGSDRTLTERLLESLSVSYETSASDLERIPRTGGAIVTVNHPFGLLDGAILASLLAGVRSDVRFLGNGILTLIPGLRDLIIPVDPISGRAAVTRNGSGIRRALAHLNRGGMLVVFPAGEVSHFQWADRTVADSPWNPMVARMVEIARVPVVPAHVAGANGLSFQLAGLVHPALRTALLARELLNKQRRRVEVRFGPMVPADKLLAIPTAREQVDYLRWRTYLLAGRNSFKARTARPLHRTATSLLEPVAEASASPAALEEEIAALPPDSLAGQSGDFAVYLSAAANIPLVLEELGRLREITFRAAGEGTGRPRDLDGFDAHYLHLFVWQRSKRELVGAYRLAPTDLVRRQYGIRGLYTATLFQYGEPFLNRIGPAVELGRSFVRQEYQRSFTPLLLLWKGIGAFVARNPQYKTLFGPVSISNQYQALSREVMISFLEKYAMMRDLSGLVRHRNGRPDRLLTGPKRPAFPDAGFDIEDLSAVVEDIEQNAVGVPVLLRQYLRLGGKLLGFNVDPQFANALDGLILVDLTKTEPKLLDRYLGRAHATSFLEFQKGNA